MDQAVFLSANRGRSDAVLEPSRLAAPTLTLVTQIAHHIARDDELQDLRSAFVDAEQPNVTVEALDTVFADISGATEHLHRSIGDAAAHFGSEQFRAGRGRKFDLEQLADLTEVTSLGSLCALGKTSSDPLKSMLRYFKPEFEARIAGNSAGGSAAGSEAK